MQAEAVTSAHAADRPGRRVARAPAKGKASLGDGGVNPAVAQSPSGEHAGEPGAAKAPSVATVKPTAAMFVGDYGGEDVSTYRFEGVPDRVEKDPNAKVTVKSNSDHAVDFVLVDSSNGKEICTLSGTLTDNGVTLTAGQKCFEENGDDGSTSATLTKGTVSLDHGKLVMDTEFDFAMDVEERSLAGTLGYHFEGARK
jgi:hypothetical protein